MRDSAFPGLPPHLGRPHAAATQEVAEKVVDVAAFVALIRSRLRAQESVGVQAWYGVVLPHEPGDALDVTRAALDPIVHVSAAARTDTDAGWCQQVRPPPKVPRRRPRALPHRQGARRRA
jgi:hypothetical protein